MKPVYWLVVLVLCFSTQVQAQCGGLDLTVILDGSSQAGSSEFQEELQLTLAIALKIGISASGVNLAGIVYSDPSATQIFLPFTGVQVDAALDINNLTYNGGGSAPGTGLYYAVKLNQNQARGVPQAILFLTASQATTGFDVMTEINTLKSNGVKIFAYGVGNCDQNLLANMVSNSNYFWYSSTFTQAVNQNLAAILSELCTLSPSTTSPYTTGQSTGSVSCGLNHCAAGAQCCSDDNHDGSDYYCCAGTDTCCHGMCCQSNQYCSSTGNNGWCVNGGAGSTTMNPYTTTGGSTSCGFNYCAPGAGCCSDDGHDGSDYYCCAGGYNCCHGSCCAPGQTCTSDGVCHTNSAEGGRGTSSLWEN